jgi:hypothetical protein
MAEESSQKRVEQSELEERMHELQKRFDEFRGRL